MCFRRAMRRLRSGGPSTASNSPRLGPGAELPATVDRERLAEEVRAIDDASAALNSGRATQTLTLLDEYDRRYRERRFAPEALYLRMEALAQLGRLASARQIAERVLSTYPNSPQSERARWLLKQTNP